MALSCAGVDQWVSWFVAPVTSDPMSPTEGVGFAPVVVGAVPRWFPVRSGGPRLSFAMRSRSTLSEAPMAGTIAVGSVLQFGTAGGAGPLPSMPSTVPLAELAGLKLVPEPGPSNDRPESGGVMLRAAVSY